MKFRIYENGKYLTSNDKFTYVLNLDGYIETYSTNEMMQHQYELAIPNKCLEISSGLIDKNGVEIFENDEVVISDDPTNIWEIIFESGMFQAIRQFHHARYARPLYLHHKEFEVIGRKMDDPILEKLQSEEPKDMRKLR